MKILSIGNSFSVDSQTWARKAAAAGGETFELGNLYIGGCSLERHMENVRSGEAAYDYFVNNENIGRASVRTALMDEKWDYVTVQQASHFSGKPETYFPFIEELADYARALAPSPSSAPYVVVCPYRISTRRAHTRSRNAEPIRCSGGVKSGCPPEK